MECEEAMWPNGQCVGLAKKQDRFGSSPTLTTCWICSQPFLVLILSHAYKYNSQLVLSRELGF